MSDDPTSLQNLHDIVVPAPVSWWPLAPGWLVLVGIVLLVLIYCAFRSWKKWHADAYRRAALRELAKADSPTAIAEILRRTALAVAPRETVAGLQGHAWADWLARQSPETMDEPVKGALSRSIYDSSSSSADPGPLRDFAARWIRHHRRPC